jgi:hypothetical protein
VSGSSQALWRSRNGYDWEDLSGDDIPALNNWIGQVNFGNGWWVATGGFGAVMRSMNMIDWEEISSELPGDQPSRTLAFGNGVFVTGRDGAGWWQSSDGTAWTQLNAGASNQVYFNGTDFAEFPGYDCLGQLCLRGNHDDTIMRSTDGGATFTGISGTPALTVGQRFAFGEAPVEDFDSGAPIDPAVRTCLGL